MGYIEVHGADLADGRIQQLKVKLPNLPAQAIDRETAVRWLRDGHSLLPVRGGRKLTALQLVEVGDDALFVRADNDKVEADALPELPSVAAVHPIAVNASPAA